MSWDLVADLAAALCVLIAAFLTLAAGVGAARFPDLLSRMHAGAKPQVLGVLLILMAVALRLREGHALWALLLIGLLQLLTAPVATHMVARAGQRTGKVRSDLLVVDELTTDLRDAERAARERRELLATDPADAERLRREEQQPEPD